MIRPAKTTSSCRCPGTRERFAREMTEQHGLRVRAVATAEEAVRGADIVMAGTTAAKPVVFASWLQPGAFVCALGRREVDASVFRAVDKFLVDDWEQVFYSKDITDLMKAGHLAQEDLYGEVWEVVTGKKAGRERPDERVLVRIEGSNWGGTMLKASYVGRGMHLEFRHPEYRLPIITSRILEIRQIA